MTALSLRSIHRSQQLLFAVACRYTHEQLLQSWHTRLRLERLNTIVQVGPEENERKWGFGCRSLGLLGDEVPPNFHQRTTAVTVLVEPPPISGPPEARVFRLHSGRRAGRASRIHQRDRHLVADRTMWPFLVVQRSNTTPTGRKFASYYIRVIHGLDDAFISTRCCRREKLFSGAAFPALRLVDLWKCLRGCSIGL